MNRRSLSLSAGGLVLASAAGIAGARAGEPRAHKLSVHVGGADPVLMAIALHNIDNAASHYAEAGQKIEIELVANGPGYTMIRADTSPVKALLAETQRKYPFIIFAACQRSRAGAAAAENKAVKDIPELPGVTDVPEGVVRLIELQEQGFAYIRV
jgi:intracellular sulfur oxidation DsrE/DsrF family protein